MCIKKFKNGNINMTFEGDDIDAFYNDEMFWDDLYFENIEGYMYLIDYNTQNVYDFSDCYMNILDYLKDELLKQNNKLKLYPMEKKFARSVFEKIA